MDRIRQTARALCCRGTPQRPPDSPPPPSVRSGSAQTPSPAVTAREDTRRRELEVQLSAGLPQSATLTTGRAGGAVSTAELLLENVDLGDISPLVLPVSQQPTVQATGQANEPAVVFSLQPFQGTGETPLLNIARQLQRETNGSTTLSSISTRLSVSSSSSSSSLNQMTSPFPDLPATDETVADQRKAPPVAATHDRIGRPKNDLDEADSGDAAASDQKKPSSAPGALARFNPSGNIPGNTEDVPSDLSPARSAFLLAPPAINRMHGGQFPGLPLARAATARQLPYMPVIGTEPSAAFVLQPRRERVDPPQVNLNAVDAAATAAAAASIPPASLRRHSSDEESSGSGSSK